VTIENNEPAPAQDTASVLFGMDGVEVTDAERGADGRLTAWARIILPPACPGCQAVSEKVHQYVTTRPRDVRACGQDVDFFLVKRRMACAGEDCATVTFTESCACGARLLDFASAACQGGDHRRVIFPSCFAVWAG
jgi:transposase